MDQDKLTAHITALLREIKQELKTRTLSEAQLKDVEIHLQTIEAQLQASSINRTILTESFMTIHHIFDEISATAVATKIGAIITTISRLLW